MKIKGLYGNNKYNLKLIDYLIDWDREVSKPQKAVKDFLYPYWKRYIVTEETPIPGSRLRMDLICWSLNPHIVIEVSPESSHSYNQFFHKSKVGFGAAVRRDLNKQMWAERNGFLYVSLSTSLS